tara:strand:+ start:38785 stop:39159 length:375 start_codon:yes stop_codon:yes gene_type:complete
MKLLKAVTNIFYDDLNVGLNLFVSGLGFTIYHDERPNGNLFCVVERDGIKFHLHESSEWAAKDRPEIRIETDDIEALYAEINESHPELLHPNSATVTLRPWGAREFAMLDESKVCVIIQQWPAV